MNNTIGPLSPQPDPLLPASSSPVSKSSVGTSGSPLPTAATSPNGEAVTVSVNAQTTTQLLEAARAADGIDHSKVATLKTAIQNGTYNVSAKSLAHAILNAAKEVS